MNYKNICVFDFETSSPNPTDCEVIQVGGIVLNNRTLEPIDQFCSWVQPPTFDGPGVDPKTLQWHADEREEPLDTFLEKLKTAPTIDLVWPKWTEFVDRFNKTSGKAKSGFMAPVPCGYNIRGFDLPISDRLCRKYGPWDKKQDKQRLFSFFVFDLMDHMWFWTEDCEDAEVKTKLKFSENVLPWMGVEPDGAHDALIDSQWCATVAIKLIKLERHLTRPRDEGKKKPLLVMRGALKNVKQTRVR
jgi:DNA polymerase III epsilon subunit-like protein